MITEEAPVETGIHIRRATSGDGVTVRGFVFDILSEYGIAPDPQGSDADVMRFGEGDRDGVIDLVAEIDGNVVGSAILTRARRGDVKLSKLFVAATARRRGVGRRLLNSAIQEARAAGYRCIEINTRAVYREAIDLYERSGWERGPDKLGPGPDRVYYLPLQTA
jgi:GNAT superfamily N-acetyltransferase